jgi:hypothetical protein
MRPPFLPGHKRGLAEAGSPIPSIAVRLGKYPERCPYTQIVYGLTHITEARMKEARGIYRVRRIGGLGSDARVTDGATAESVYRARGYQPDFDKLPWKDKYDARSPARRVRPKPKAGSAQPCREPAQHLTFQKGGRCQRLVSMSLPIGCGFALTFPGSPRLSALVGTSRGRQGPGSGLSFARCRS